MKVTKLLFQEQHPLGVTWSDPLFNCYPYLIVILTHVSSPPPKIAPSSYGQRLLVVYKERWDGRGCSWERLEMLSLTSPADPSVCECTWHRCPGLKPLDLFWRDGVWSNALCFCNAIVHGWCRNQIFSLVFWCVSSFGACSGSAALETVFFDFYKAYLKHFCRCCVPFPLHHPLIREKQSFLLGMTTIQAVPSKMLFNCFSLCLPNG